MLCRHIVPQNIARVRIFRGSHPGFRQGEVALEVFPPPVQVGLEPGEPAVWPSGAGKLVPFLRDAKEAGLHPQVEEGGVPGLPLVYGATVVLLGICLLYTSDAADE